jgi:hypothetical protein
MDQPRLPLANVITLGVLDFDAERQLLGDRLVAGRQPGHRRGAARRGARLSVPAVLP